MRLHHILLYLADRDKSWVEEANVQVERFINNPAYRSKEYVDDLGRYDIYCPSTSYHICYIFES